MTHSAGTSSVPKLTKKEITWIRLLRQLKHEYVVNFDLSLHEALALAGIANDQVDLRLLSVPYVREPFERGIKRCSIGLLNYGRIGATTRKVLEDIALSRRLAGTLHVALRIAEENRDIGTDIKILMLGTTVKLDDTGSSGWAPRLILGPNTRKIELVYRAPVTNAMGGWPSNTQHLAIQLCE